MEDGDRQSGGLTIASAIRALDASRILFVHQSVGQNIVEGLAATQVEVPSDSRIRIVDLTQTSEPGTGAYFAHARLGTNGDPRGKTDAFVAALEHTYGSRVDIAFQKYCFADINASTDVNGLFEYYRQAMDRVEREFPSLKVVHVTAPLVQVQSGPKALVKRLLGRTPDHYDDNIARERFNALMRKAYEGTQPVFDLAAIEASRPGREREPLRFQDQDVYELRPEYTSDGAHLNDAAEKRVAVELMVFLAQVARGTLARTGGRE